MIEIRRFHHRAMATLFEVAIPHRGESEAVCLAETLFAEIDRVESLLSRFDPASEVSRLNRSAARVPVRVDSEFFALLALCQEYQRRTGGAFDPAGCSTEREGCFDCIELDPAERSVLFQHPAVRLDFGAVGKGYALEGCRRILTELSTDNLFLHGGTSSVLALGDGPHGDGWPVALLSGRTLHLWNRALSTSAIAHPGMTASDLIDPRTGDALSGSTGCTVIADCAVVAEILSTAFLVMGRDAAEDWLRNQPEEVDAVHWVEKGGTKVERWEREGACA